MADDGGPGGRRQTGRRARRPASLNTYVFGSFVALLAIVFTIVGWLSFRNAESTAQALAARVAAELSSVVYHRLAMFIDAPMTVLATHIVAVRHGLLDVGDADRLARVLWNDMTHFRELGYLSFGGTSGDFVGVERLEDGTLRYHRKDARTGGARLTFDGSPSGERGPPVRVQASYDPRERPWFKAAIGAETATWTALYPSRSSAGAVYMTAVAPAIDAAGERVGVIGADVVVSQFNAFLRRATAGRPGQVYVLDRDGLLVATSTGAEVVETRQDGLTRRRVGEGGPALLRAVARTVRDELGGFGAIDEPAQVTVSSGGETHLLALTPLLDGRGVDWIVATLVPEDALMADFDASARETLWLFGVALALALTLAFAISRRIASPLAELTGLAERIRGGDLDVSFERRGPAEVRRLGDAMGEMVRGLRDRDFIRDAFGRYVTPELVDRFIAEPESLALGGQLCGATLLMSDLRGFTSLSERLPASEMVTLLNDYLGRMTEVILRHEGTIIEFIGDAIFVVFGAPFPADDDAERAVRCAIDMQRALSELNAASAERGRPTLEMGVGVNSGEVVAGNLGSERAAKYGVVGEAVNLTARIESLTVGSQVLMSEATRVRVGDVFELRGPREVRVKGVATAIAVHEVVGVRGAPELTVPRPARPELRPVSLDGRVFLLSGYLVREEPIPCAVVALSVDGARIRMARGLRPMTKIVLRVALPEGRETSDVYASVVAAEPQPDSSAWRVELIFTSSRPEARAAIARVVEGGHDDG